MSIPKRQNRHILLGPFIAEEDEFHFMLSKSLNCQSIISHKLLCSAEATSQLGNLAWLTKWSEELLWSTATHNRLCTPRSRGFNESKSCLRASNFLEWRPTSRLKPKIVAQKNWSSRPWIAPFIASQLSIFLVFFSMSELWNWLSNEAYSH